MTAAPGSARAAVGRRGRSFSWSSFALLVHSWLGLKLTLILAVVLLSGTLAVFRAEIDWLTYPQMRVAPAPTQAGLDAILSAVTAAYPDMALIGDIPTGVDAGSTAVGIIAVSPARGVRTLWVDPYRGRVQGDTPLMTLGFFLARLHQDLFIPEWGYAIVCTSAIVITLSLVTGLIAYKRFWRGFLRRPRLRNARTLLGDLHRLTGLWSLWFLVVMAVTGLWYFWTLVGEPKFGFPKAATTWTAPVLPEERLDALGPAPPRKIGLDEALARAVARYPDFTAAYVALPSHHGAPLVFRGTRGEVLARYATSVAVDPYSGQVLGADLASEAPLLNRVDALVDPIHYGDFAGLASKAVWFVFGLGLSGLAVSGLVIFWYRTRRAAAALGPVLGRAWHPWRGAMGWLKPLNWAVLVVTILAAVMAVDFYSRGRADLPARFPMQAVGDWRLGANLLAGVGDTRDPVQPGGFVLIVVDYCTGCWDGIRRLWASIGAVPPTSDRPGARVSGQPGFAFAPAMLPADLDGSLRLWLTAEGWDGRRHVASWPLRGPNVGEAPRP